MPTKRFFLFCTDVKGTKERPDDEKSIEALWNNWIESKKCITNRDNHAVRSAGNSMAGKAVPSGKGMEAWVEALFDKFYQAQLAESDIQKPGLGGSDAKAASVGYGTAASGDAALDAGTSLDSEVQEDEEPAEDLSPEKMKDKTRIGQALSYTAEGDEPAEDLSPEKKGTIQEVTAPDEDCDGIWNFHVVYPADNDEEDLTREEVEADLIPPRPEGTTGLEGSNEWVILKTTYECIRHHVAAGTLDHRSETCIRGTFGFMDRTQINAKAIRKRHHMRSKILHADKPISQPARVEHLAKQVLYVLKYLSDSVVQDSWAPQHRTVDDRPTDDDYPEYYSEAFASAASTATEQVLLEDLTQPEEQGGPTFTEHAQQPGHTHVNNDDDDDDDDDDDRASDNFNDLNGPTEGNNSLLEPDGSIPDTFEADGAVPLDDFILSNLKHSMWVPKSCLQLWAEVFAHIIIELLQAIASTGPQRLPSRYLLQS